MSMRPPDAGWWPALRAETARFVRAHKRALAATALVLASLAVVFNAERVPYTPTSDQLVAVGVPILVVADCLLLAWLLRSPAPGVAPPRRTPG